MRIASLFVVASVFAACGDDAAPTGGAPEPEPPASGKADRGGEIPSDWSARVEETWLRIDVGELRGEASIWFEPGESEVVSLEAGGLTIDEVYSDDGALSWELSRGVLDIAHPASAGPIHIDYRFAREAQGEGLAKNGSTVLWPTFCGNLFPCRSDPSDGQRFALAVTGFGSGQQAIYPESIDAEVPSYTLAFALGRYGCEVLGTTGAGTSVSVCWLPNGKTRAQRGTRPLVAAFDWLEQHLGRYAFGKEVASVAVSWGEAAAGGMEHHPYWHVATSEMDLPITHVHEAVHGWFGAGVRIACWEDFVLSEGTTTYLAARALGAVTDAATEEAIWESYREELYAALEDEDVIAWPRTCGEVDLLKDGLFSNIVYMKGAFFWREVARAVGPEVLDAVLARFYEARVGTAARMQELLDAVERDTGFSPGPLAEHWLRSHGDPF